MKTQTQIAASGLAASSASAKAAEASATAAERALKADRPFLLVPTVEVRGFNTTDAHPLTVPLIAWVYFHNFGRGPAILEEILLRLVLVEPGMYPSPRDYADTASVPLNSVVIVEPGKRSHFETNERDGLDARAEVGTLIPRQKELIVYGRVRYRDVAGASWETGFLWAYHPAGQQWGPTRLWGDEYVSPGPSSHNYGT